MSLTRPCALAALLLASSSIVACGGSDEPANDSGTDTTVSDATDAGGEVQPDATGPDSGTDAGADADADAGNATDVNADDSGTTDAGVADSGDGDSGSTGDVQGDVLTDAVDTDSADPDATDIVEPTGWFADDRWPGGVWGLTSGLAIVFADGFFFADVGPAALAGEVVQVDYEASQFVLRVAEVSESPLAGLWVRIDWILSDELGVPGQGWFCLDQDGEPSLEAALASSGVDSTNLETGCYGGGWELMYPRTEPAFTGNYVDEFDGFQELGPTGWRRSYDGVTFEDFSYVGWIESSYVAKNADTNEFSPGRWSRFDVVVDGEAFDQLWYCQTVYDGATLLDAVLAPLPDVTSLTTNGCSGFAWTSMLPSLVEG
jgi:hypothetical protein